MQEKGHFSGFEFPVFQFLSHFHILLMGICLLLFFLESGNAHAKTIQGDCTYKGIPLYGKVALVKNFADIKVRLVKNFPDLKVKFVDNFAGRCGEWQIVEHFPDFTVEIVKNFGDIDVELVDNFPGLQ